MTHEEFVRDVLGNHTEIAVVPYPFEGYGVDDILCRCADVWFLIDAEYVGNYEIITEESAREILAALKS